jgi:hypothetical protein
MFSDSHFEIEKSRGRWRITAKGWPALGIGVAATLIACLAVVAWMSKHLL